MKILYEDSDILIVDKPSGLPTCRLKGGQKSLEEMLMGSPTAVHRLDTETSGLVVFAKNQKTYEKLREDFSKNRADKEYTALVHGIVTKPGKITWPIGPDLKSVKKVRVYKNLREARRHKALEAVTNYEPITPHLLRITIKTGRRHQIRVHLAAIGHPIVGDTLYGGPAAERLHLHASRLSFHHPSTNQPVEVMTKLSNLFHPENNHS